MGTLTGMASLVGAPRGARRSPLAAAPLAALLLVAAPSAATCPQPVGASLRIQTWNLNLQVTPNNTEVNFGMLHQTRAGHIARQVLADDADVVVFNEANDDEARDVLIKTLKARYPNYIALLDEHDISNDSGLMLFSKYGFLPLDQTINDEGFQETWHDGRADEDIASWDVYSDDDSNGDDAWANKGFALVRIRNECEPGGQLPFNVGFTHMQSSKPDVEAWRFFEDVDDRRGQLRNVREIIEGSIAADRRNRELIFVVGDLNIDGKRKHTATNRPPYVPVCQPFVGLRDFDCPGDPNLDQVQWLPHTEWELTFDRRSDDLGAYWACGKGPCTYHPTSNPAGTFFVDAWAFETSPLDVGQTHSIHGDGGATVFQGPTDGERLDYLLHNKPVPSPENQFRDYCVQHLTRATRGREFSDHISLTLDLNQVAPRCSPHPRKVDDVHNPTPGVTSPNGPEPVTFDLQNLSSARARDVEFTDGTIAFPGSMQWYVLEQGEPFSVELTGAFVDWEMYQGADLSTPLPPYNGECAKVGDGYRCKYSGSNPPYFVRVFAVDAGNPGDPDARPDRTRHGLGYRIRFHRFDCSSPEEACALEASVGSSRKWPAQPLGAEDTMFFELLTEHDRQGVPPAIELTVGMGTRESGVWPPDDDPERFEPVPFSLALARKDGTPIADAFESIAWHERRFGASFELGATVTKGKLPGANGWPEKYLMKVARHPVYRGKETTIVAAFDTSLTYFHPVQIACLLEETDLGGDDIWTRFRFDGPPEPAPCRNAATDAAEPDCLWVSRFADHDGSVDETDEMYDGTTLHEAGKADSSVALPWALTGGYQVRVVPNLWQDGEGVGGAQYLFPFDATEIPALPMYRQPDRAQPAVQHFEWKGPPLPPPFDELIGYEYRYYMAYRRRHARPECQLGPSSGCPAGLTCTEGACK